MTNTHAIQQALLAKGFNPGPIDGLDGPTTRRAIRAFRQAIGLPVTEDADREFMNALFEDELPPPPENNAAWFRAAHDKLLLHEKINNAKLWSFLKRGGGELGDPSKHPWCGDFVETCLALTLPREPLPKLPYLARGWLDFGRPIDGPCVGAIVVLYRGKPTGSFGHVGFYYGEDKKYFHLIGGNQANRVSIARMSKKRLLGMRWPSSVPFPGVRRRLVDGRGQVSTNEA